MARINIPASPGAGALTLVETQTIAGADALTVVFNGLNGDADGMYEFSIQAIGGTDCTVVGAAIVWNPNAVASATNAYSVGMRVQNPAAASQVAYGSTVLRTIGFCAAAGKASPIFGRLWPKTGVARLCQSDFNVNDATTGNIQDGFFRSGWSDGTGNITSLTFSTSNTLHVFGIGSVITLWKRAL